MSSGKTKFADVVQAAQDAYQVTWQDFTSNTTFHGIKYIFHHDSSTFRRVLWILCVVAAISLFSVQVYTRFIDYYKYDSNINVDVFYGDKQDFPAVTICNQNTFRMSAVVEYDLYSNIDEIYMADNLSEVLHLKENMSDNNLINFYLNTSHSLEDFIERCTWMGEPLVPAEAFHTVLTALGVCFVFNGPRVQPTRQTKQSGLRAGLELVLNVEQYEHMRGPENDAGVKVLLHHPEDKALIKDLGFAVAPGTHTLVGIRKREVLTLEPPWGMCKTAPMNSMTECLWQCKIKEKLRDCRCMDYYMTSLPTVTNNSETEENMTLTTALPEDVVHIDKETPGNVDNLNNIDNLTISSDREPDERSYEICDLFNSLLCSRDMLREDREPANNTEVYGESNVECNCTAPCYRVQYQPSLSQAQLSKFNIDKMALPSSQRRQVVYEKFMKAREISQRVIKEMYDADNIFFSKIIARGSQYSHQVATTAHVFSTGYQDTLDMSNVIGFLATFVSRDWTVIDRAFDKLYDLQWEDYRMNIYFIAYLFWDVEYYILKRDWFTGEYQLVKKLERCTKPRNETVTTTLSWYQPYPECSVQDLLSTKEKLVEYLDDKNETLEKVDEQRDIFLNMTDYIYTNTSRKPEDFAPYRECIEKLEGGKDDMIRYYDTMEQMLRNLDDHNLASAYNTSLALENMTAEFDTVYSWSSFGACTSFVYHSISWDIWNAMYKEHQYLQMAIGEYKSRYVVFFTYMQRLYKITNTKIQPLLQLTLRYLHGEVTKSELAETLSAPEAYKSISDLSSINDDLSSAADDLEEISIIVLEHWENTFKYLFNFTLPVMDSYDIQNLSFPIYVFSKTVNVTDPNADLVALAERLTDPETYEATISILNRRMFGDPVDALKEMQGAFLKGKELYTLLSDMRDEMKEYLTGNKMDTNFYLENFMQINIFYEELSYEKVEQLKAFEWMSLVSEVGGFLGLLLGASILTMCELFDYIFMQIMKYVARQKRVGSSQSLPPPEVVDGNGNIWIQRVKPKLRKIRKIQVQEAKA